MGNTTDIEKKPAAPPSPKVTQAHDKFKAFITPAGLTTEEAETRLNELVGDFTKDGKSAPKSVGVEYLEGKKRVVLTLGYRDDEPGYPVKLTWAPLGKLDLVPTQVEEALSKAAGGIEHVLCHEFFVDDTGEFVAVFMSHG